MQKFLLQSKVYLHIRTIRTMFDWVLVFEELSVPVIVHGWTGSLSPEHVKADVIRELLVTMTGHSVCQSVAEQVPCALKYYSGCNWGGHSVCPLTSMYMSIDSHKQEVHKDVMKKSRSWPSASDITVDLRIVYYRFIYDWFVAYLHNLD